MRLVRSLLLIALITCANTAYAEQQRSVMFFASNNTGDIDVGTAYQRLKGQAQQDLQAQMITVIQQHHLEQGRASDILGAYDLASTNQVTADNTESFLTSPYQAISERETFRIAKELAVALNQESVAVFLPAKKGSSGEVSVVFTSQPTINDAITAIRNNLPAAYSEAYSLHLAAGCVDVNNAKVQSIEWLGSKINYGDVKQAFPNDTVSYMNGTAYLVYQSGKKQPI